MQSLETFLMFSGKNLGKAQEAINLYTSLFDHASIDSLQLYEAGEAEGTEGTVKEAHFQLAGQRFMAHDSKVDHKFNFTPSVSIFVTFDQVAELERVYNELKKEGMELVPLGDYGFSKKFVWLEDRYGISWQLGLAQLTPT